MKAFLEASLIWGNVAKYETVENNIIDVTSLFLFLFEQCET